MFKIYFLFLLIIFMKNIKKFEYFSSIDNETTEILCSKLI